MKLLRHGAPGAEKPGLLDKDGKIRDLTGIVPDIAGCGFVRCRSVGPPRH